MVSIDDGQVTKTHLTGEIIATIAVLTSMCGIIFLFFLSSIHFPFIEPYMMIFVIIATIIVIGFIWRRYLQSGMLWTGRIFATLATALAIFATISVSISNVAGIDVPLIFTIIAVVILLSVLLFAWWKTIIGAILLLITSIAIWPLLQVFSFNFNAWLITGLPFAIAGTLLFTVGILTSLKMPNKKKVIIIASSFILILASLMVINAMPIAAQETGKGYEVITKPFGIGDNDYNYNVPIGSTIVHTKNGITYVYDAENNLILAGKDSEESILPTPAWPMQASRIYEVHSGSIVDSDGNITKFYYNGECILTVVDEGYSLLYNDTR